MFDIFLSLESETNVCIAFKMNEAVNVIPVRVPLNDALFVLVSPAN
jgi:hypothetical protein